MVQLRILEKSGCPDDEGYVDSYKLDSFVTHNFVSKVRLERNGKAILDRVIIKADFTPLLDASLRRYAVMMCPYIIVKNDSVRIEYSISIPLTDVGQLKYAVIDGLGNITFRDPGPDD